MKIWDKGVDVKDAVINFTVGDDYIQDKKLVYFDCIASIAHAKMLFKINLLTEIELSQLVDGLNEIISLVENNEFEIKASHEDCHTAIEAYLTEKLGDVGKKIHTGRSRNDQVLTALRLFEKMAITEIINNTKLLVEVIDSVIRENGQTMIPGYTHMRKAMPSSISMWLGSFKESLIDDLSGLENVLSLIDQSPLGTAAGFGVPVFELDREQTAQELGFNKVLENPMYAQISRGKFEGNILNSCGQLMLTLNKLASDLILFSMTEFNFLSLPKEQCTGSSIMPQKINPDVLELVRAKYHDVIGEEFKIKSLIGNLMSGYNRDVQLTKASVLNSLQSTSESVNIMTGFLGEVSINKDECLEGMSEELFATEKVNELVKNGMTFRDAYREIGSKYIENS